MRLRLTDLAINGLKPLPTGQYTAWDQGLKGFGLRVSVAGTKSWVIMTGRERRLTTLSHYPATSLKDARNAARLALAQPFDLPASINLQTALDAFYAATEKRVRPKTIYEYRRCLNKHLEPLFRKQLKDLSTENVMRIIDGLHATPIEQLHTFLVATTFFRFCVRRRFIVRHPLHGLQLPGTFNERDRVLSSAELVTIYRVAQKEPYPFGPIVLLCILTGQRRGEVSKLRCEYIDQEQNTITLPKHITKNGLAHTFPYGSMTQTLLDAIPKTGGYLFPGRVYRRSVADDPQRHFEGWSRAKQNFDRRCPVEDWTLHDLRRTFRTIHAQIGTPPHIGERLVNHISISSPVSKIYDRYKYLNEMREAVANYEAFLVKLLA